METHNVSVLAEDLLVLGEFKFSSEVHLYSKIIGVLRGTKTSKLIIRDRGSIEGDIHGENIIVEGFVKGQIICNGTVHITSTGRVIGKINTKKLIIDPGATVESVIEMS